MDRRSFVTGLVVGKAVERATAVLNQPKKEAAKTVRSTSSQ